MRLDLTPLILTALVAIASACGSSPEADSTCGPQNCNGCCTTDGVCVVGVTDSACGTGGAVCSTCLAGHVCTAQACVFAPGQSNDGGTADGGETTDGGNPNGGLPITASPETWTWVDFPDAVCGNGSATGLGVNPGAASTDLLIYMEGGGACWNELTCRFGAAANLTGYGASDFAVEAFRAAFAVDRTQTANPFKDMSYVYIPYCTGDVHAGDAIQTYGTYGPVHHKGAKNVEAFLKRLAPTFKDATRVFLSGASAGAYGAQFNYERVAAAFPNAEVHVFADCGQMINPSGTLLSTWTTNWNVTTPAACVNCTADFPLYPAYLATTYANRRFALLAFQQDGVLTQFFGYTGPQFQGQTEALLTNSYDPYPNAKYFLLPGTDHVMLKNFSTLAAPDGGTTLMQFTQDFVDGSPTWSSVRP